MPKQTPKEPSKEPQDWKLFHGDNRAPHDAIATPPETPPWRPFGQEATKQRGATFQARSEEIEMVNAALYLRRPLLITGKPGTGKSSLAYAVAHELKLGEVLYWPITTRTTLKDGLYSYDAIGRLQSVKQSNPDGNEKDDPQKIADYITLGPLGTALLECDRPRIIIIDEIDKSDIDLPNDLLTIFEEGRFEIPELARLEKDPAEGEQPAQPHEVKVRTAYTNDPETKKFTVKGGRISCKEFPLVILTSNGERDFPPAFLRRCLRLNMRDPKIEQLKLIITAHLKDCDLSDTEVDKLIQSFLKRRDNGKEQLSTDQLLNALFMILRQRDWVGDEKEILLDHLLAPLDRPLEVKSREKSTDSKGK
jgi:MoxR-like ATPase